MYILLEKSLLTTGSKAENLRYTPQLTGKRRFKLGIFQIHSLEKLGNMLI